MSLALAFKKNATSLAQAQNTYKQNVIAVNTLVTSVSTTKIPNLSQNPPDWKDFLTTYEKAKGEALDWVNNIMARLLKVPDEVKGFNSEISQSLQVAKKEAEKLVDNPHDKAAVDTLKLAYDGLTDRFSLLPIYISATITQLQNFKSELPSLAAQLQTIAEKSAKDAHADMTQIGTYKSNINVLRADINAKADEIVEMAILDGVTLTLGLVVTIAAWPEGLVAWFILAPGVGVFTTFIGLDAADIVEDKEKIKNLESEIKGLNADVTALNVLADNFNEMAQKMAEIKTNLQAVLEEWQNLESDVNTAINDLNTAISDTKAANFVAVLDDINDTIQEWNATYTQAGRLHIDLQVNNAQLEIGQSSSQVKDALAGGQTFDIIEYYNQVMNAA